MNQISKRLFFAFWWRRLCLRQTHTSVVCSVHMGRRVNLPVVCAPVERKESALHELRSLQFQLWPLDVTNIAMTTSGGGPAEDDGDESWQKQLIHACMVRPLPPPSPSPTLTRHRKVAPTYELQVSDLGRMRV